MTSRVLRCGFLVLLTVIVGSGCSTLSYYCQAVRGQYQLLAQPVSTAKLQSAQETPPSLKQRFDVVEDVLCYADHQLALPINGHYREYLDLGRDYVVWNVEAAPELSLEPKTWWYPFVGRLDYRGYFSEERARHYANALRQKGYDVYVEGVDAYSTLGWFKDPLLSTFIHQPDPWLAELLFHELAHQRVFVSGDTYFNEAFATAVGQQGTRRWLRDRNALAQLARYDAALVRNRQFVALVMRARQRLEALYGDVRDESGRLRSATDKRQRNLEELRAAREAVIADLRREFQAVKQQWNGAADYDRWFAEPIGNAKLNSVAAYYDLVPGFEALLAQSGGDWRGFYTQVKQLAKMQKADRHRVLREAEARPLCPR